MTGRFFEKKMFFYIFGEIVDSSVIKSKWPQGRERNFRKKLFSNRKFPKMTKLRQKKVPKSGMNDQAPNLIVELVLDLCLVFALSRIYSLFRLLFTQKLR